MHEPAPSSSTFPTARCNTCGKTVLTYLTIANEAEDRRACVHCDTAVDSELRWIAADELTAEGYEIGARPEQPRGSCGGGGSCSRRGH